ncbi:MAG: hypothetical protein ACTHJQ_05460, partial [Rhizobiaceae bacterium]
ISSIRSLVDRRNPMRARQMLEVLAKADLKPITAHQIKAVELLLTDAEFIDQIEPEALTDAIAGKALALDDEAKLFAAMHKVAQWRALASVWFKRSRKKRRMAA